MELLEQILLNISTASNLTKREKIIAIMDKVTDSLPITLSMMVKPNLGTAKQLLYDIEDEKINDILDILIDILCEVRE